MMPQDLKYDGERTTLEIGADNTFREMVTAHPGTGNGGGVTRIGSHNMILCGVHIAHDCLIGDHCIFANGVQFGGHVHVEDYVNMGGVSAGAPLREHRAVRVRGWDDAGERGRAAVHGGGGGAGYADGSPDDQRRRFAA